MTWLGVAACALILALNVFRLPFLWDDFDFLGRAAALQLKDLLPDSSIVFYRPLSREVYFWVVTHLFGESALAAHVLNAAMVVGIVAILVAFLWKLSGPAAGLLGGLIFACSASIPLEISWASSGQDLLCTLFIVLALYLQLRRRPVLSALAMAAALLSKETAAAVLPVVIVLAAADPKRTKGELLRSLAAHGLVVLAWVSVHPWIRPLILGSPSGSDPSHEYIALRGATLIPAIAQGIAITLNTPWSAWSTESPSHPEWPPHLILPAVVATVLVFLLLSRQKPGPTTTGSDVDSNPKLAIIVGSIVFAGSIALTSLVLGRWSPHYACIPALGLSMAAATLLSRAGQSASFIAITTYLWLGIGLRGNPFDPIVPSEINFSRSADALQKVERGFKLLHGDLPPSNVYVSIQTRGAGGLYRQMFRFQPLRVWYRQPKIWVLDPNRRRPRQQHEYLFWIDPELKVYEVALNDFSPRGPTADVSLPQYQKTLRGYALGLAGSDDVDRAVYILANMPQASRETWVFDRRIGVALLLAANRNADAERLAVRVPSFSADQSFEAVVALLAEPIAGLDLDRSAMQAFGLDPSDILSIRRLMRTLEQRGFKVAAGRFATRLQLLLPGDSESAAVLERTRPLQSKGITVPIPFDIPQ